MKHLQWKQIFAVLLAVSTITSNAGVAAAAAENLSVPAPHSISEPIPEESGNETPGNGENQTDGAANDPNEGGNEIGEGSAEGSPEPEPENSQEGSSGLPENAPDPSLPDNENSAPEHNGALPENAFHGDAHHFTDIMEPECSCTPEGDVHGEGCPLFTIPAEELAPAQAAVGGVAEVSGQEYATLAEAVENAEDGATVSLLDNVDISASGLQIDKTLTLDLKGKNLKAANTTSGNIVVTGHLTLEDSLDAGKIYTESKYSSGASSGIIEVDRGTFTMNGGEIYTVQSNAANEGQFAVTTWNGGKIFMNDGKIAAGWYAISGNGTNQNTESYIEINGGELISTADYAIYHPQNGKLIINDGTVYGAAGGIVMNSGALEVNGGTITSKGTGDTGDWGDGTGGLDNAAIELSAKYSDVAASLSGGTFLAEGNAVVIQKGSAHSVALTVRGGKYSSDVSQYLDSSYGCTQQDGLYVVAQKTVAQVNGSPYPTLAAAVAAVGTGKAATITLVDDIVLDTTDIITIATGQTITLDMAGHKITCTESFTGRPLINEGHLTITGNGTIDTSMSPNGGLGAVNNKGTLTIHNGTYRGSIYASGSCIRNTGATSMLTVHNGVFEEATCAVYNEGSAILYGGTYTGRTCSSCNSSIWSYTIRNSTVDSKMTIEGGTYSGVQGAVSASIGHLEVNSGTFKTVACENHGTTATFYALYAAGEDGKVKCIVNGGHFETEGNVTAVAIGNDNTGGDGGINAEATGIITGGTFVAPEGVPALIGAEKTGDPQISGGSFSSDNIKQYIADGYLCSKKDNMYVVEAKVAEEGKIHLEASGTQNNFQPDGNLTDEEKNALNAAKEQITNPTNPAAQKPPVGLDEAVKNTLPTEALEAIANDKEIAVSLLPVLKNISVDPANEYAITEVTYDVTPHWAVEGDPGTKGEITSLNGAPITFYLPIPDSVTETYAVVTHLDDPLQYCTIQRDGVGCQYIAVTATHFSPFTLTFTNTKPSSGNSHWDDNEEEEEYTESDFWNDVKTKIKNAKDGATVKINAGSYRLVPRSVLEALAKTDVTLVIRWNGGEAITIPAHKALAASSGRQYLSLSSLEKLYKNNASSLALGSDGTPSSSGKVNPATGVPALQLGGIRTAFTTALLKAAQAMK